MKNVRKPLSPLGKVLEELQLVLTAEREALRRLDRNGIDQAATEKLRLDDLLRATVDDYQPTELDLAQLTRIRAVALENQLLLTHARSCVQGVLALVTGDLTPAHPLAAPRTSRGPVALNIQG